MQGLDGWAGLGEAWAGTGARAASVWRQRVAGPGELSAATAQAIVFVCGPGNYLEYLNLRERAQAAQQQAGATSSSARNVVYGCTEVQTGSEFLAQARSPRHISPRSPAPLAQRALCSYFAHFPAVQVAQLAGK